MYKFCMCAFLLVLILLIGFPLFMTISVSLQTMPEIYSRAPMIWPARMQFVNYVNALGNGNWPLYTWNSLVVTALTTAISLIINSMAGFVFARLRFHGRGIMFSLILIGMMIPPQVTMIPVFTLLRGLPFVGGNDAFGRGGTGLMNTYAGLILPFISGSFGVFLCRQFYIGFPSELDDAALIDGCGRLRQFLRIYLPLSGPVLASLAALKFTGTWNEYTWPLVMTSGEKMKTVQIALTSFRDESEILWNRLMAATLIGNLPIYIVFLFAQKYFVQGLLQGSIK